MSSVNKVILGLVAMYESGQSIPQISARTGINRSRVRSDLLKAGVTLRQRADAVRMRRDVLGQHAKGVSRDFTPEWKANISAARQKWSDENAVGTSHKASGYVIVTRGPDKDRGEHVVIMEKRLGRRLLPDECVHHIDRDRSNNDPNNLALVTRSGHTRLHRFEDRLERMERMPNVRVG